MIDKSTQSFAALRVFDCPPDVVTNALGLLPSKVYYLGETTPPRRISNKQNCWELLADCSKHLPLDEQIDVLLEQLTSCEQALTTLTSCYDASVTLVSYQYEGPNMSLFLQKTTIAKLGHLGLSLDLDFYCLSD